MSSGVHGIAVRRHVINNCRASLRAGEAALLALVFKLFKFGGKKLLKEVLLDLSDLNFRRNKRNICVSLSARKKWFGRVLTSKHKLTLSQNQVTFKDILSNLILYLYCLLTSQK